MVVNSMNAGSAIASNAPLMTRNAAKVAKFFETACTLSMRKAKVSWCHRRGRFWSYIKTAPHMKILNER
jgi:hypothetical protein